MCFLQRLRVLLQGAASHAAAASLSMSVSIQGLGPRFRLLVSLSNEGQDLATDLQVRPYHYASSTDGLLHHQQMASCM